MRAEIVTDDLKAQIYRLEGAQSATPARKRRWLERSIIKVERAAKREAPVGKKFGGTLREKIGWKVEDDGSAVITAGVVYGRIQEFGGVTKPHEIRAKERPYATTFSWRKGDIVGKKTTGRTGGVLAFQIGGKMIFRKSVNHPGSRIKGSHYTRRGFEQVRPQIEEDARKMMAASAGKGSE
jgi:phage gpG-like protein